MRLRQKGLGMVMLTLLSGGVVYAQDASITPQLPEGGQQRITPAEQQPQNQQLLTTHKISGSSAETPAPAAPSVSPTEAPFVKETPTVSQPVPFAPAAAPVPAPAPKPMGGKPAALPAKMPFGHASMPLNDATPSGPHTAEASPVSTVDAVESSEPAPPTPVAPEANPAAADPTEPTELTSPLFNDSDDLSTPRKIVFRVLNKVTAQSTLYKVKPAESVRFGRLEVTAISCRISAPNSLPDSAGLLDISEHLPGNDGVKPLFHGWMYASSPSIAALEHPIYDVTMVDCDTVKPEVKVEKKPAVKAKK